MIECIAPGVRVRVLGNPVGVTLRSNTGTVARPDDEYEGYWIVRFDEAAIYHAADGSDHILPEIREYFDNLHSADANELKEIDIDRSATSL